MGRDTTSVPINDKARRSSVEDFVSHSDRHDMDSGRQFAHDYGLGAQATERLSDRRYLAPGAAGDNELHYEGWC
jgi:hypothetical protein